MKHLSFFLMSLVCAVPAWAAITVDPDAFAEGTDISNAFSGITLSAVGVNARPSGSLPATFGASGRVFAIDPMNPFFTGDPNYPASTGSLAFGHDGMLGTRPLGHEWTESPFNPNINLRVDFHQLVRSVSIDFISDDGNDTGMMRAYDSSGNLLETYITQQLTFAVESMSITRNSADIAYVVASGKGGSAGGLDHLSYAVQSEAIPEPCSCVLWGVGGLSLLVAIKRRRSSPGGRWPAERPLTVTDSGASNHPEGWGTSP